MCLPSRSSSASAAATTSISTPSRSRPAGPRGRRRRPGRRADRRRARRSSASSPSTWRCAQGRKCFYTTPIKALSNQKYADLVARLRRGQRRPAHRRQHDQRRRPDRRDDHRGPAQHALRGLGTLTGLGYVVMDEVHYLSDRFRGAVWEEVIIHLPESVRLVSLSATVSNAEEFGDWLDTVRGDTEVIVAEHRPVPLWQHVMAGAGCTTCSPTAPTARRCPAPTARATSRPRAAGQPRAGPAGREGSESAYKRGGPRGGGGGERGTRPAARGRGGWTPEPGRRHRPARRRGPAAGHHLHLQPGRLRGRRPAVPARRAAAERRASGPEVRAIVEERTAAIPDEDLHVLGYYDWLDGLERGVAAHHAGMLPTFKEVVEELFVQGLVKAVFATETLALGINMPARSVVLEKLVKWNGETHADLTARRVHPAHRPRRAARHRRRGPRGGAVAARPGPRGAGRAGRHAHLPAALDASSRPTTWPSTWSASSAPSARANCWRPRSRSSRPTGAVVGLARQVQRNEEGLDGLLARR